jgi:hypothetical protein
MRPVHRIEPLHPPTAYKTYGVARPLPSHFRPATCREVDCGAWLRGWQTIVDVSTDLGARQANYIRMHSGRSYTCTEAGTLVTFTFPAGQRCFGAHRLPLERPPLFTLVDGDWRGNPTGRAPVVFGDARGFVDDFGEHQQRLADRVKRG